MENCVDKKLAMFKCVFDKKGVIAQMVERPLMVSWARGPGFKSRSFQSCCGCLRWWCIKSLCNQTYNQKSVWTASISEDGWWWNLKVERPCFLLWQAIKWLKPPRRGSQKLLLSWCIRCMFDTILEYIDLRPVS